MEKSVLECGLKCTRNRFANRKARAELRLGRAINLEIDLAGFFQLHRTASKASAGVLQSRLR